MSIAKDLAAYNVDHDQVTGVGSSGSMDPCYESKSDQFVLCTISMKATKLFVYFSSLKC